MKTDPSLNAKGVIVLINFDDNDKLAIKNSNLNRRTLLYFNNTVEMFSNLQENPFEVAAIISKSEILGNYGINIIDILNKAGLPSLPVFLIVAHFSENLRNIALNGKIADVFTLPLEISDLETRVNFTIENWSRLQESFVKKDSVPYKTPFGKRLFDIVFSSIVLLALSPFFLLIYVLIRLESPGPAFYYSYRVGTGYRIFKFYKFRSMYIDADKRLHDLKHLNQYNNSDSIVNNEDNLQEDVCNDCLIYGKCQFPLYADSIRMCEKNTIKMQQRHRHLSK